MKEAISTTQSASGRAALLAVRPQTDILVTNAGVPQRFVPYRSLTHADEGIVQH